MMFRHITWCFLEYVVNDMIVLTCLYIYIVMYCFGFYYLEDAVTCFLCCSYFIKLFLDKKYALPYRALDAVLAHFMQFLDDERVMPVIWHQSLLAFVER